MSTFFHIINLQKTSLHVPIPLLLQIQHSHLQSTCLIFKLKVESIGKMIEFSTVDRFACHADKFPTSFACGSYPRNFRINIHEFICSNDETSTNQRKKVEGRGRGGDRARRQSVSKQPPGATTLNFGRRIPILASFNLRLLVLPVFFSHALQQPSSFQFVCLPLFELDPWYKLVAEVRGGREKFPPPLIRRLPFGIFLSSLSYIFLLLLLFLCRAEGKGSQRPSLLLLLSLLSLKSKVGELSFMNCWRFSFGWWRIDRNTPHCARTCLITWTLLEIEEMRVIGSRWMEDSWMDGIFFFFL